MTNRYKIETLEDMLSLTDAQFKRFLPDLINAFESYKAIQEAAIALGIETPVETSLTWVDDGKNEQKIGIKQK